jgi:PPOX class probable F420-dependent enzyme
MDPWARLAGARVARFATRAPRIVPVTFAIAGETIYHAVDHKPKATRALARLEDLRADPRASLLVDHYDDADWGALWWVRADGRARVLDDAPEAIDLLVEKYAQYRERRPQGPVVALDVERIKGWSAT